MRADLHFHSIASDGRLTCEQIAECAHESGVELVSLTDHDNTYLTGKLNTYCKKFSITAVCGVEVSAYIGDLKLHTLGYAFDPNKPSFKAFMRELTENSYIRTEAILSQLKGVGIDIKLEEVVKERICDELPVHMVYVARAAVKAGYSKDVREFIREYLLYGKVGNSNIARPSPERAIDEIKKAGGIAVLAHPGRIDSDRPEREKLIRRLASAGLDGIEAVYTTHTESDTAYFTRLAEELGLFVTGGSDTHFPDEWRKIGTPRFEAGAELVKRLTNC